MEPSCFEVFSQNPSSGSALVEKYMQAIQSPPLQICFKGFACRLKSLRKLQLSILTMLLTKYVGFYQSSESLFQLFCKLL